jgi:hypothetical protein
MPAMVALYDLDETNHLEYRESQSVLARQMIDKWAKLAGEGRDWRMAELDEVAKTALPSNNFYSVMDDATNAIVVDGLGNPYVRHSLARWRFGDRFDGWSEALEADYVVFVKFKGAYETSSLKSDQTLKILLGGWYVVARRIATLAVVDLKTGHLVCVRGSKFDSLSPSEVRGHMTTLVEALGPTK